MEAFATWRNKSQFIISKFNVDRAAATRKTLAPSLSRFKLLQDDDINFPSVLALKIEFLGKSHGKREKETGNFDALTRPVPLKSRSSDFGFSAASVIL